MRVEALWVRRLVVHIREYGWSSGWSGVRPVGGSHGRASHGCRIAGPHVGRSLCIRVCQGNSANHCGRVWQRESARLVTELP